MTDTNIRSLYVADLDTSSRFYAAILDRAPVQQSPTFVMFILDSGLMLGLWRKDRVAPGSVPGGADLGFKVGRHQIEQHFADWQTAGARIAMPPTDLDFGRTFVALDPDGHRLRVYAIADETRA